MNHNEGATLEIYRNYELKNKKYSKGIKRMLRYKNR
jgi:hypothetical protein